jgi:hypothetical protein
MQTIQTTEAVDTEQQSVTGDEMLTKSIFRFTVLSIVLAHAGGCSLSATGTIYKGSESVGEEFETTGVVNGLWQYDVEQNRSRLKELLPEDTSIDVDQEAKLYQVRVGIRRGMLNALATEVVVLPEGWSYTTTDKIEGDKVINIGDVVSIRARKNRMVDYLIKIVRKCNLPAKEDERPEWNIGCQSISEFDDDGYAGNKYYWTAF